MAEIVLERVSKSFGAKRAVADLSLTVQNGEFVVLLGPTGAGKTTALRLVAGLETPESGRILIGGNEVTRATPAERDVAFVFQQYSLYPHYTVFDNLAFPLRSPLHRRADAEIRETVTKVAKLLGIESKLSNRSTRLSGGEMQRVAIGRALVRDPAVFLMDEPLSSLDAKLRADLRVELKRIQFDLGATILYVTHDQIEAMTLADRIGVLAEGRLIQIGTPKQIYAEPDNTYVACRLGSPRINLLPVSLFDAHAAAPAAATVGVRPEDIVLDGAGVLGRVVVIEPLGAETVVEIDVAGYEVLALRSPSELLRVGQQVRVSARNGAALYFDGAGNRIPEARGHCRAEELSASHGI